MKFKTTELKAFTIVYSNEWLTIKTRAKDFEYKVRVDTRDYQICKYLIEEDRLDELTILCQTLMAARLIFADIKGNCVKSVLEMASKFAENAKESTEDDSEILKEEQIKNEYYEKK